MKKLKIAICIIAIVTVICTIVLVINLKKENSKKNNNDVVENNSVTQEELDQQENNKSQNIAPEVSNDVGYKNFYTISNCISQYLDTVNKNNSKYYGKDKDGNMVLTVPASEIAKNITCLLSDSYKNNENINESNVFNKIQIIDKKYSFVLIDVLPLVREDVNSYGVYGLCIDSNNNYIMDKNFIVNLDESNMTFSIEDVKGNYTNLSQMNATKLGKIEKNSYNSFEFQDISTEYISIKYLESFKQILFSKPELAYKYLNEEYRKNRFGDYNYFIQYINTNKTWIKKMAVNKYKANDDNSKIVVTDQEDNRYTFYITGTMKYSIKMDNYIIMSTEDIEEYNSYDDLKKYNYCIHRWIKMINNKDYKFAYEYLDQTFRENTFGSEDKFENYMKEKYPLQYDNCIISKGSQDGNIYTAEVEFLKDNEEFSEKYMTIIIRLDDDAQFTLSFNK